MTDAIRVAIEHGPKGKRAVAFALDWPGWSRAAKTGDDAIESLEARLNGEFDALGDPEVVEQYGGIGSTDFWGISFASAPSEKEPMSDEACERKTALLKACWAYFDDVAGRVSAEMRKGSRGGGRDRDQIISHTFGSERTQMAKKVGVQTPEGVMLTPDGLRQHREAYVAALREYQAAGKNTRSWTLAFLIRHSAYHVLDHAWEMEDKSLEPLSSATVTGS
jgi:hypothetical protein